MDVFGNEELVVDDDDGVNGNNEIVEVEVSRDKDDAVALDDLGDDVVRVDDDVALDNLVDDDFRVDVMLKVNVTEDVDDAVHDNLLKDVVRVDVNVNVAENDVEDVLLRVLCEVDEVDELVVVDDGRSSRCC